MDKIRMEIYFKWEVMYSGARLTCVLRPEDESTWNKYASIMIGECTFFLPSVFTENSEGLEKAGNHILHAIGRQVSQILINRQYRGQSRTGEGYSGYYQIIKEADASKIWDKQEGIAEVAYYMWNPVIKDISTTLLNESATKIEFAISYTTPTLEKITINVNDTAPFEGDHTRVIQYSSPMYSLLVGKELVKMITRIWSAPYRSEMKDKIRIKEAFSNLEEDRIEISGRIDDPQRFFEILFRRCEELPREIKRSQQRDTEEAA